MALTPEHREKLRQAKLKNPVRFWLGKARGPMSDEQRQKIGDANRGRRKPEGFGIGKHGKGIPRPQVSAAIKAALASPEVRSRIRRSALGRPLRHGTFGQYRGIWMRSSFEIRAARAFDALGMSWEYEPKRFDLGEEGYTPDFYLPNEHMYVEVKGWYGPNSARKCSAFFAQHPQIALAILQEPQLLELESLAAMMPTVTH